MRKPDDVSTTETNEQRITRPEGDVHLLSTLVKALDDMVRVQAGMLQNQLTITSQLKSQGWKRAV